jgi:DNA-binding protein H-NS
LKNLSNFENGSEGPKREQFAHRNIDAGVDKGTAPALCGARSGGHAKALVLLQNLGIFPLFGKTARALLAPIKGVYHGRVRFMPSHSLESTPIDELWSLYEQLTSTLARRIADEKAKLEERLRKLGHSDGAIGDNQARRPYPKVLPKYQNPRNPGERWSGRGKKPRWVRAQLRAGKKLEHLRIADLH